MKKYLLYILILIVLVGFFGLIPIKQAGAIIIPSGYAGNGALGTCTLPVGSPMLWTETTCLVDNPGTNWVEDTGNCSLGNMNYYSCVKDHRASSAITDTTQQAAGSTTYGACVGYNWQDTKCHDNAGTFTPIFSGTPPLTGALPLGTCSMTHVTDSSCGNHGGHMDSTGTLNYGANCLIPNVTQYNCTVTTSTWFKTLIADLMVGTNAGGDVTTTWYGPGVTPGTVAQQDTTIYTLLAPLPNGSGQLTTFNTADKSALGNYLNIMIKLFIGICAVLAMIMIVLGGIEYMTSELISNKEEGKERIRNAIFGLLLALCAWTLLNTINPNLFKSDINIPDVAAQAQLANEDVAQTPVNGKYGGYTAGANFSKSYNNGNGYPLATLPAGVTVNKTQCVNIGDINCTSTMGLDPSIINTTASGCKTSSGSSCQLTITGGTEFWLHGGTTGNTSHGPGSATVDLAQTPDLNKYITGGPDFPKAGNSINMNNICYYAEQAGATTSTTGNHWHAYKGACQ